MISVAVTPHLVLADGRLLRKGKPFEMRDTGDLKEVVIGTLPYVTAVLSMAFPDEVELPEYEGRVEKGLAASDYCWAALGFLHTQGAESQELGRLILRWAHLARLVVKLSPTLAVSPEGLAVLDFLTSSAARSALCMTRQIYEEILEWKRWRDSGEGMLASLTGEGLRKRPAYPIWSLALPWPERMGVRLKTAESQEDLLLRICSDIHVKNGLVSFPFMCGVVDLGPVEEWLQAWMAKVVGDDVFVEACFTVGTGYQIRATKMQEVRGVFYCFRVLPTKMPDMSNLMRQFAGNIPEQELRSKGFVLIKGPSS